LSVGQVPACAKRPRFQVPDEIVKKQCISVSVTPTRYYSHCANCGKCSLKDKENKHFFRNGRSIPPYIDKKECKYYGMLPHKVKTCSGHKATHGVNDKICNQCYFQFNDSYNSSLLPEDFKYANWYFSIYQSISIDIKIKQLQQNLKMFDFYHKILVAAIAVLVNYVQWSRKPMESNFNLNSNARIADLSARFRIASNILKE